jgi:hypothetical protein
MRPAPYNYQEQLYSTSYPISTGGYYQFRVRHDGDPGELSVAAELWYDGLWRALGWSHSMRCMNANGSSNCYMQFMGEAYTDDIPVTWFALNAPVDGAGVNFQDTLVRVNPNDYRVFLQADFSAAEIQNPPYHICWSGGRKYSKFRAKHASC